MYCLVSEVLLQLFWYILVIEKISVAFHFKKRRNKVHLLLQGSGRACQRNISLTIFNAMYLIYNSYTRIWWGKRRFLVVCETQSLLLCCYLLIIVLCSIQTTRNLRLPILHMDVSYILIYNIYMTIYVYIQTHIYKMKTF